MQVHDKYKTRIENAAKMFGRTVKVEFTDKDDIVLSEGETMKYFPNTWRKEGICIPRILDLTLEQAVRLK